MAKQPDADTAERLSRVQYWLGEEYSRPSLDPQVLAPHVFIGIGGTGARALKALVERLSECLPGEDDLPSYLQFVFLDTNNDEISQLGHAAITPVPLTVTLPDVVWDNDPEIFEELGFPAAMRDEHISTGAFTRVRGRFGFVANASAVNAAIEKAIGDATKYPGLIGKKDVTVHVVFSVVGGTGCGAFLDTAFLIRNKLYARPRSMVFGYCVYPDGNVAGLPDDSRWASAGAALRELEYFMQLGSGTFTGWGEAYTEKDRLRYSKTGAIGRVARPFDVCYLFGGVGPGQGTVQNPDEFGGVLAEAIVRNSFAHAGTHHRSQLVNIRQAQAFDVNWAGKYASFSALGYSRIRWPERDIEGHLVMELADHLCNFVQNGKARAEPASLEAQVEVYCQRLSAPLPVSEFLNKRQLEAVCPPDPVAILDAAFDNNKLNEIKSLCDSMKDLSERIWTGSERTRRACLKTRRQDVEEIFDFHVQDLTIGLRDDRDTFEKLFSRIQRRERGFRLEYEARQSELERRVKRLNIAARELTRSGVAAFFRRKGYFQAVKGLYPQCLATLQEALQARQRIDLARGAAEDVKLRLDRLDDAVKRIDGATARFTECRHRIGARLHNMRFGKGSLDKKTFCWVGIEEFFEHADQMLTPERMKIAVLLGAGGEQFDLSIEQVVAKGSTKSEKLEEKILLAVSRHVRLDHYKASLQNGEWSRNRERTCLMALEAASPMIQCAYGATGQQPRVVGCYANFDANLARPTPPADTGGWMLSDGKPVLPDSDDVEVTRFFHGICLKGIASVRQMGDMYREYMAGLKKVGKARDVHNLFHRLGEWTAPDEPAPPTLTRDEPARLWALGLMFSWMFPPSEEEAGALARDAESPKIKQRKNFIFRTHNFYYLQRYYDSKTLIDAAPPCVRLGNGRDNAREAFCRTSEYVGEMRKWLTRAQELALQYLSGEELVAKVRKYRTQILGKSRREREEAEIILDFEQNEQDRFGESD